MIRWINASMSRRDLEGDAEVVGAAPNRGAIDISLAVQGHAVGTEAVVAVELVHGAVFPLAILLGREFVNHPAKIGPARTRTAAASVYTIEVPGRVKGQVAVRAAAVIAVTGEVVYHCHLPPAARLGTEFEDHAVA